MSRSIDEKYKVLAVEDEPGTVSGTLDRLRSSQHLIDLVEDAHDAEAKLQVDRYDLILVDLRLPRNGVHADEGGLDLTRQLIAGALGPVNGSAPIAILTAFPNQVPVERLPIAENFLGVFSKLGSPLVEMRLAGKEHLDWLIENESAAGEGEAWIEDILSIESPERDGEVLVLLNGWDVSPEFKMPVNDLPVAIRQELLYGDWPVRFWARVDVAAETAKGLKPHELRLIFPEDDELALDEDV